MAAAETVGDQQRILRRGARRGQQVELGHLHRQLEMFGLVTEGAGHATTARIDHLDFEPGNQGQYLLQCRHGCKCLLVAMPVYQRPFSRQRLEF